MAFLDVYNDISASIFKFDISISRYAQKGLPNPKDCSKLPLKIIIYKIITNLVSPISVILGLTILTFLAIFSGHYFKEIIIIVLAVFPVVIGTWLKKIIGKCRPNENMVQVWGREKRCSFPSTHAAVAVSLYGFFAYLAIYNLKSFDFAILAIIIIGLICYSRIILGLHYFTDIIAGIFLGFIILLVNIWLYNYIPENLINYKHCWILIASSWFLIINYYRKYPSEIPKNLKHPSDVTKRIYTAFVIILMTYTAIWLGGIAYKILIWFIMAVGIYEISIAKTNTTRPYLKFMASMILIILTSSLIDLRSHEYGKIFTIIFVLTSTISDISGYLIGKNYGSINIFRISPQKTLEGTIASISISTIIMGFATISIWKNSFLIILILAVASLIGDLLASWLKRKLQIKDFSNFLPGHGGILDRVDSQLFCGFIMYILVKIKLIWFI